MRVLHVIPHLSGGGAERQLNHLAPEMARLGHEVHIAYLEEGPESVSLEGVNLHRVSVSGNHDPTLFFRLLSLVRTIRPNIIQSWILMMDITLGIMSLTNKIAWVLREPTSEPDYQSPGLKKKLRARLAHRASAIICNSPGGRAYWLGQEIRETRLSIIPNAVPIDRIDAVEPTQHRDENQRVLIYAGRLIESKNVDVLVHAMAEVNRRQDAMLWIAGEGPSKPGLIKLVQRLELEKSIRFVGFLRSRELWAHMKAADAFISLSSYEGMPNCVCEAVACGTPVILSDIPVHRAILNGDSAVLIPPDSVAQVANAILHTLDDAKHAEQRASRALEAIQAWRTEEIAARYLKLYSRLLAGKEIPS
jgi:glycosyltransferase involved in cell wall biosynthesis